MLTASKLYEVFPIKHNWLTLTIYLILIITMASFAVNHHKFSTSARLQHASDQYENLLIRAGEIIEHVPQVPLHGNEFAIDNSNDTVSNTSDTDILFTSSAEGSPSSTIPIDRRGGRPITTRTVIDGVSGVAGYRQAPVFKQSPTISPSTRPSIQDTMPIPQSTYLISQHSPQPYYSTSHTNTPLRKSAEAVQTQTKPPYQQYPPQPPLQTQAPTQAQAQQSSGEGNLNEDEKVTIILTLQV